MFDDSAVTYLQYREDVGLKTNKRGLKHKKLDPKVVDVYNILNSYHCPLCVIGMYLSLLPEVRTTKAFYLQALREYTPNCWFQDKPMGVNKLQQIVKILCKKGGLPGYYTNHSLRATAATRLYHANFDEQVIQEVTGFLAVHEYKRTCPQQHKIASMCVGGQDIESSETIQPPFKKVKLG